jgi:dihydropyrimidine dehydrogenase (NAD+) subunit PreA
MPTVGSQSTQGGYCGPAVKPIALHMVGALARDPRVTIPISGIGGIADWRDAAEFLALGATSVQVCTAVMHGGYRIVEDMIEGLNYYLEAGGLASVTELVGKALPGFTEWGDLDLNYNVIAKIDSETCIGCQLCYIACLDGAHQCIHTHQGPCAAYHGQPDHGVNPRDAVQPPIWHKNGEATDSQVPFVDERECIGCNLCSLVCPVPGCITMEEVPTSAGKESWNDRLAKGTA